MMNKKILWPSAIIIASLFVFNNALAQAEFSQTRDIGTLINEIFRWSMSIVGIAVFINFLWAGVLWLTAAGRPGQIGSAKEKMTNSLIGFIVLLAAYLILKTINPDLVQQTFTLPGL